MIRLTREQVREVDRRSIEEYHIPGIVLMENAARGATAVAIDMLADKSNPRVLIFCGGGNNGGDGLAIARHLHNHAANISLFLTVDANQYSGDAQINWRIAQAMNLHQFQALEDAFQQNYDLIVDAIFGTGLSAAPRPPAAAVIEAINQRRERILAIDLPSGLDCDTGKPLGACVQASRTVTFVAEKAGFANPDSKHFTGEVTVADIGCPRDLIYNQAR